MRLATKFTAALMVVLVIAFGIQSTLAIQRTASAQELELSEDLTIAARSLAKAAGRMWELEGEVAAKEFLHEANDGARTEIDFVTIDQADDPKLNAVRRDGAMLRITVPVLAGGEPVAGLRLQRNVTTEQDALASMIGSQIGVALGLVTLCGAIALVLGVRLIGRPVEALIAQARAVAKGRYDAVTGLSRGDELGRLATEMDLMAHQLSEADAQVKRSRHATATLQQQLRHADRLSTLGRLASTIAHELGTPLNVVSGRAGIIGADPDSGERAKKNAGIIVEQSQAMTRIIQQILAFARRQIVNRTSQPLAKVVDQAITLLEPLADEEQVRFVREGDTNLEAPIDEQKTLQVLTNLMINATQAMPEGGTVRIRIMQEEVTSPPDARCNPGQYACIQVEDDGLGMTAEQLDHIFEPFYTTKTEDRGTGLGLSVCQGIMREHDGFMTVKSTPGAGSCFSIYLAMEDK